jgi:hypothetical protein
MPLFVFFLEVCAFALTTVKTINALGHPSTVVQLVNQFLETENLDHISSSDGAIS